MENAEIAPKVYEKRKKLIKKVLLFFPLILIIPGVLFAYCWFTCSDWGPLAAAVWFIGSAFVIALIELVLILVYIYKFPKERNVVPEQVPQLGAEPSVSPGLDFIDKVLLFYLFCYFVGYLVMFPYAIGIMMVPIYYFLGPIFGLGSASFEFTGIEAQDIFLLLLGSALIIGLLSLIFFIVKFKNGNLKATSFALHVALVMSAIAATLIALNFDYLFGALDDGLSLPNIIALSTIFGGFMLYAWAYFRLQKYCGQLSKITFGVVLGVTMLAVVTVVATTIWVRESLVYKPSPTSLALEEPFPMASSVDMAGWKSYTNNKEGYSISYPIDWSIVTPGAYPNETFMFLKSPITESQFTLTNISNFRISSHTLTPKGYDAMFPQPTLEEMITKESKRYARGDGEYGKMKPITFAEQKAYEGLYRGSGLSYVILLEQNGRRYKINLERRKGRDSLSQAERDILSTFRFVPIATSTTATSSDIATTTTKNVPAEPPSWDLLNEDEKEFGFQIKYPLYWERSSDRRVDKVRYDFYSYSSSKNVVGEMLPREEGVVRVELYRGCNLKDSKEFIPAEEAKPHTPKFKSVCKEGYQLVLWLWSDDAKFAEHEMLFNEMVESFKNTR